MAEIENKLVQAERIVITVVKAGRTVITVKPVDEQEITFVGENSNVQLSGLKFEDRK